MPRSQRSSRREEGRGEDVRGALREWRQLLATRPTWEARQAESLRAAVEAAFPGARQAFKAGWRAVTFADEAVGFVCGVFVMPGGASLYVENGAALDDPDGLFTRRMTRTAAADFGRGRRIPRRAIAAMIARSIALASVGKGARKPRPLRGGRSSLR